LAVDEHSDRGRRLLRVFKGEHEGPPPLWLMRQAGRYLPEYRATRTQAGSFLDLCYTPSLAAEVTLQPIRRYDFDAAILFSDILVVPHALGQSVDFVEGEGPRLSAITDVSELRRLDVGRARHKYTIVAETVARLRQDLPREIALIGFCGAPWTVATYMVAGRGTPDQAPARLFAYRDPAGFGELVDLLVATSADYLCDQVAAGADVLQIFDTWAGALPDDQFERWVIQPTRRLVAAVRSRHPEVPIIGFPRGAQALAVRYALQTGLDGVGCDTSMPLHLMSQIHRDAQVVIQGNLDPLLLLAGGEHMRARARQIVMAMSGLPHIFNLGHGILPQTPPENVRELIQIVRSGVDA